jgi:hypothetical protein
MEVARVAHFTQKTIYDFLELIGLKSTAAAISTATPQPPPPLPTPEQDTPIVFKKQVPIDVAGFFMVTGPQEATFYATTTWTDPVGPGWTVLNVNGLIGQVQTTGSSNVTGNVEVGLFKKTSSDKVTFYAANVQNQTLDQEMKDAGVVAIGTRDIAGNVDVSSLAKEPYNWSFTMQTDTDQVINEVRYASAVSLYPPGTVPVVGTNIKYTIDGYYTISDHLVLFVFTGDIPPNFAPGWMISNLTKLPGTFKVNTFAKDIYAGTNNIGVPRYESLATLESLDSIPDNNSIPVYASAKASSPSLSSNLTTIGTFTVSEPVKGTIKINPNIVTGLFKKFRDLNTDIPFPDEPRDLTEIKDKRFSSAAIMALFSRGPQDEFLITEDPTVSHWKPTIKQHTNSIMYHRVTAFPGASPTYQGNVVQVALYPNQLGDLLSNMYLRLNLPPGVNLAPNIGRSLVKQVDFIVNETVIETLYDDWYIIRDQMFLDADEQYTMSAAMSGINGEITIPLEFFFCRRHSVNNNGRERLKKPYFPTCAMKNQLIYIRFTFYSYKWWTDSTTPVDFINPVLITEEILLENKERMYYRNTPLRYIVNSIKKDATLAFTSSQPVINLTAAFPVQTLAWFFRNKNYENINNQNYYDSRYTYGYTTQYIHSSVPMNFPSGNTNFIDVITSAKLTLNNMDVTSVLPGGLYFGFKQPMEHFLSVPSKNIYSYSFGLTPKEYNQGGYLNFSKLNSQTTTLTLTFNPTYSTQVQQGYVLYVFYYGYNFLQFQGGFAGLPFAS